MAATADAAAAALGAWQGCLNIAMGGNRKGRKLAFCDEKLEERS